MADQSVEHELQAARRQRRAMWALAVFALLFLPVLIGLGVWQLNRAAEKELWLRQLEERATQAPVDMEQLDAGVDLLHRRVELIGRYDSNLQWLLDNRTHEGRFGYEVVTAFELQTRDTQDPTLGKEQASRPRWILVNRGWIAASPRREELPEIPVPEGPRRLLGHLTGMGGKPLILRETPSEPGWPRRVQYLDTNRLEADAALDFPPWLVRLDTDAPGALIAPHQASPMGPDMHRGYAVQWFGLAGVLVIGSLIAFRKIKRES